jgi:hypothetical protein
MLSEVHAEEIKRMHGESIRRLIDRALSAEDAGDHHDARRLVFAASRLCQQTIGLASHRVSVAAR